MSSRDVRNSHSVRFFEVTRRTEENIIQRPKRIWDKDNTTPAILVNVPFKTALTKESLEVNNDLHLTENQKARNTTYPARKHEVEISPF